MEDERIIDVDERTWREKLNEKRLYAKLRIQNLQKKASKFYHENETVINSMAASAAVALGGAAIKNVSSAARYHRDAKLEKDRKSRIWNPRTGSYIPLIQISGEKATLHGVLEPPSRSNRATLSGK